MLLSRLTSGRRRNIIAQANTLRRSSSGNHSPAPENPLVPFAVNDEKGDHEEMIEIQNDYKHVGACLKSATVISLVVLLTSCSTSYQSHSFTGGYSETQLAENVYRVTFKGNGYTSSDRAADLSLMRAAEIGLENGFTHFVIVDNNEGVDMSITSAGAHLDTVNKPKATNTVAYFSKPPQSALGIIYDARFIFESISKKYGIELPLKGNGNKFDPREMVK